MGTGNYPQYADVVEAGFVQEICKDEYDKFIQFINEKDVSIDDVIEWTEGFDLSLEEDEIEVLEKLYDKLINVFDTKTGLSLYLVHHIAEDRGDELDGIGWAVDKVYDYTSAGEKYKNKIIRKFWTVFG